jgi:hypothetical protein
MLFIALFLNNTFLCFKLYFLQLYHSFFWNEFVSEVIIRPETFTQEWTVFIGLFG